jgi:hypothetical protein
MLQQLHDRYGLKETRQFKINLYFVAYDTVSATNS